MKILQKGIRILSILSMREAGITLVTIFLMCILSLISPRFFSISNFLNVGRQIASLGIMAFGLGLVIIAGNIDLSIGATYGLASVISALILTKTGNTLYSLGGGLLVGVLIGALNGLLVIKIKIPSFIATFGMMNVTRGICLIITRGYPVSLDVAGITQETNPMFYYVGQGLLLNNIPMQFVFMLGIMTIMYFILHKTIFGLHIYSVGSSIRASFTSGVNIGSVVFNSFIISGILSALAGILALSFISSVLPVAGQGLEFTVFAAVVIGGTSMAGGEGSVIGIAIGALLLGVLKNGLVLIGMDPFWQVFIIGIITICAVIYDSMSWQKRQGAGIRT